MLNFFANDKIENKSIAIHGKNVEPAAAKMRGFYFLFPF